MFQWRITRAALYPFTLTSTIFHEFGHALACWLTGGRVSHIRISFDESGLTRFAGGSICLVLPAGYIGSSLAGAVLLAMGFGIRSAKWSAYGVLAIVALTVFFAGSVFTVISAAIIFVLLLAAVLFRDGKYTRHVVLLVG